MPFTGGRSECDPVAITAERKVTSSPPSTAIVFGPVNAPRPFTMVMPLALTTPVMPFTSPSTMPVLFFWAWPKSSSGSFTRTPSWAKFSRASLRAWAVCTHVLVGMQPTVMQVPPTRPCSIRTTFAPSCAARIAAGYPPGPPPRTATSHSIEPTPSRSLFVGGILVDRQARPPAVTGAAERRGRPGSSRSRRRSAAHSAVRARRRPRSRGARAPLAAGPARAW